jgi:glycosyltransferase involved in cell wall biosynthesis
MKISVFITSFNQKQYLIEAIDSVLAQTLPPSEIVIVDDCSQDGSQELIAGYASRYPDLIKPIYHVVNRGVSQTRIDALNAVTGDCVTYVDGDDRFLVDKLEREAQVLQRLSTIKIVYANNYYITAEGVRTRVWADEEQPPEGDVFYQTFARDFPRHNLFRMELVDYRAWKRVGFHDPNLRLYEDWDMRIRLTKHYRVAYCKELLSEIRVHSKGLSSAGAAEHLAALEQIVLKNEPLLDDIESEKRDHVYQRLGEHRARMMRRAAREVLDVESGQRTARERALALYIQSWKYHLVLDRDLLSRLFLPDRTYRLLKSMFSGPKSGKNSGR